MRTFPLFLFCYACAEKENDTAIGTESTNDTSTELSSPTSEPANPTSEPSVPTSEPASPTSEPTSEPTEEPSTEPSSPTSEPASPSTEPTSEPTTCTLNDLEWVAQMRTSTGNTSSFQASDELSMVGIIQNPCTETFVLTTMTTCLLSQALLQSNSGTGTYLHEPICGFTISDWVIPGGGSVEEVIFVGTRPADTYTLELIFADPGVHSASLLFSVSP